MLTQYLDLVFHLDETALVVQNICCWQGFYFHVGVIRPNFFLLCVWIYGLFDLFLWFFSDRFWKRTHKNDVDFKRFGGWNLQARWTYSLSLFCTFLHCIFSDFAEFIDALIRNCHFSLNPEILLISYDPLHQVSCLFGSKTKLPSICFFLLILVRMLRWQTNQGCRCHCPLSCRSHTWDPPVGVEVCVYIWVDDWVDTFTHSDSFTCLSLQTYQSEWRRMSKKVMDWLSWTKDQRERK